MTIVGTVESLWRYPVKGMRGEALPAIFLGFAGVYGDRLYAIRSSTASEGFPWFTAREREDMVLYRPRFRDHDRSLVPPNLSEAQSRGPGVTPIYHTADTLTLDVETPSGRVLAISDPALLADLAGDVDPETLALIRSDRALTDCRPVSLISLQTVQQIETEAGVATDKRRFRANIYAELRTPEGFAEDRFIGHQVKIGARTIIMIVEHDPRCKVITLDPDTAAAEPVILREVATRHNRNAGVFGVVLQEGVVQTGDLIELVD